MSSVSSSTLSVTDTAPPITSVEGLSLFPKDALAMAAFKKMVTFPVIFAGCSSPLMDTAGSVPPAR